MPSSVTDRPTTDHEYLFMFAVTPKYYYDADAIREPHITFTEKSRMRGGRNHFGKVAEHPRLERTRGIATCMMEDGTKPSIRREEISEPSGKYL